MIDESLVKLRLKYCSWLGCQDFYYTLCIAAKIFKRKFNIEQNKGYDLYAFWIASKTYSAEEEKADNYNIFEDWTSSISYLEF